jgi:hypothetical protein
MKIKLKKKLNKYAQVHTNLLRDRELSLKAKGLAAVLESFSNNFNISIKSIVLNSKDGIKAIKTAVKELEDGYYLFRFQKHNKVGQFITYWVFDSQKLESEYLSKIINELGKVEFITKINKLLPRLQDGTLVNNVAVAPFFANGFSASGFSNNGTSTTYNIIHNKNNKDNNTLSIKNNKRDNFNFKDFRKYSVNFNLNFSLSGKLGYSKKHLGFCIKNQLLYSYQTQKLVNVDEAFQIWDYLFKNRKKFYKIIDDFVAEQNDK